MATPRPGRPGKRPAGWYTDEYGEYETHDDRRVDRDYTAKRAARDELAEDEELRTERVNKKKRASAPRLGTGDIDSPRSNNDNDIFIAAHEHASARNSSSPPSRLNPQAPQQQNEDPNIKPTTKVKCITDNTGIKQWVKIRRCPGVKEVREQIARNDVDENDRWWDEFCRISLQEEHDDDWYEFVAEKKREQREQN